MKEIQCKAIVLSSFNYRDYDRIVSLYTDLKGLIKVIIHGANRPKSTKLIFCQPFTLIDLIYLPKKGDIHSFKEGKVLNAHLHLRDSFDSLQAAVQLLDITTKSQIPEEPSAKIFPLLMSYLQKMNLFGNPYILSSSFLLKILLIAGQWTVQTKCNKCSVSLQNFYFVSSSYYCAQCTPSKELEFNLDEMQILTKLIGERSFNELNQVQLSQELQKKINMLFLVSFQ